MNSPEQYHNAHQGHGFFVAPLLLFSFLFSGPQYFIMNNSTEDQNSSLSSSRSNQLNQGRFESPNSILSTASLSKRSLSESMLSQYNWQQELNISMTQLIENTPTHKGKGLCREWHRTATIKCKSGQKYEHVCPICLFPYEDCKGGLKCSHQFCFECISKWALASTACPCCRSRFTEIVKTKDGTKIDAVKVEEKDQQFKEEDYYVCYICGRGDNQNVLLICDGCDFYCCHIYCDQQLDNVIPEGDWFCVHCRRLLRSTAPASRAIPIASIEASSSQSDNQDSIDKGVATRTRSREHISSNIAANALSTLRNIRRQRR